MNDRRESLYESLMDATGEGTKSGALDAAARFYCQMEGDDVVNPNGGKVKQLMELADEQGSVGPREIAEILDTDELPVAYQSEWSVGQSEN